jgi:hypothetical protein
MDIGSVDGGSGGAGEGPGGWPNALVGAKATSALFDADVAGSVGAGPPGRGWTEGAAGGAAVGDDAAATDGVVASAGRISRSTNAQATMTAVTSMGTSTRGIVGRSMRGWRGSVPARFGRSERE